MGAATQRELANMKAEVARMKRDKEAQAEQTAAQMELTDDGAHKKHKKHHKHRKKQAFGQTQIQEDSGFAAAAAGATVMNPASNADAQLVTVTTTAAVEDALPPGWASRVDDNTGRMYYYKTDGSGQTAWDRPTV